jgi:hypothetical protein
MPADLVLLAAGAAVAGFVQGLSGFAFGMVAMSIWVWGVEPRVAAVMTVMGGDRPSLVQVFTVRRGLRLAALAPFLAGAVSACRWAQRRCRTWIPRCSLTSVSSSCVARPCCSRTGCAARWAAESGMRWLARWAA